MLGKRRPWYMHALSKREEERFREDTENGIYDLTEPEIWWRDRGAILEDHGYRLRPRLQPGWTPSWQGTKLNPRYCEDGLIGAGTKMVDAVRISDGKEVAILRLENDVREAIILRLLSTHDDSDDHHIVPLLDSFSDDREPILDFFVLPLLREHDEPECETVGEVLDMFKQALEGLAYMHQREVAHRDCSRGNLMMDASAMFPKGFHPRDNHRDRGGMYDARIIPRRRLLSPVRYYLIDFGLSKAFEPNEAHKIHGGEGADLEVPEFANRFNDPFLADIFIMGNFCKKDYVDRYQNFQFLVPFIQSMTATDPTQRPTAADALQQLEGIISKLRYFKLHQRLVEKGVRVRLLRRTYGYATIVADATVRRAKYVLQIPSRSVSAIKQINIKSRFSRS